MPDPDHSVRRAASFDSPQKRLQVKDAYVGFTSCDHPELAHALEEDAAISRLQPVFSGDSMPSPGMADRSRRRLERSVQRARRGLTAVKSGAGAGGRLVAFGV